MERRDVNGGIEAARRTLELLWGRRSQSERGPRRGLSVARIVNTAIEIADSEGLEALTMRRVADRLGVGAMSLYTYVSTKDELVSLMLDAVMGYLAKTSLGEGGWRARLELYARESWALYQRHPWVLQAPFSRALIGPNQAASLELVLRTVSDAGLPESEVVTVSTTLASYVQGAARVALDTTRLERDTDITDEQWWSSYGALMDEFIADPERYPTLTSLSPSAWSFEGPEAEFEFGLQRTLDGIEMLIDSRAEQR